MAVKLLPLAEDDVLQALTYIGADNPDAADRLYRQMLDAMERAGQFPYAAEEIVVGSRRPRRYYRLSVPPYHLYYRTLGEDVLIMRVLHQRMDAAARL